MILDVGCGGVAVGDVNVDLFIKLTEHRPDLTIAKAPNLINASAEYLPFKSHVFDLVTSHHVLEHVNNPFLMLKEMARVSSDKVNVVIPHRLHPNSKHKTHKTFWSTMRLHRMIQQIPDVYSINTRIVSWRFGVIPYEVQSDFRVWHKIVLEA